MEQQVAAPSLEPSTSFPCPRQAAGWWDGVSCLPQASCLLHTCLSAAREAEISKHKVKQINITRKEMGSELSSVPLHRLQAESTDRDN